MAVDIRCDVFYLFQAIVLPQSRKSRPYAIRGVRLDYYLQQGQLYSLELSDLDGKDITDVEAGGLSLHLLDRGRTALDAVVPERERLSQQRRAICSAVPCTETFAEGSQHDGIVVGTEQAIEGESDLFIP